jgi:hypothetical protein
MKRDNDYSVIAFFESGKAKKWQYVHNLRDFASFLDKKHSTWEYMNIYNRRTGNYLKRFYKGNNIPIFI